MSSNVKQVANAAAPVVKRDINKWLARIRQFLMLVRGFLHIFFNKKSLFSFREILLIINVMNLKWLNGKIKYLCYSNNPIYFF
jgi:hypothetical protein